MKKLLFGILVLAVVLSYVPAMAQMPDKKIEPVEEPKDKKDAKKYDLKIVYTKGMTYERTFKMKVKMDMGGMGGMDIEVEVKSKITVNDVKDNMPIDFKCEFLDVKVKGEAPEQGMGEMSEIEQAKLVKGHWIRVKINDKGEFELADKSKDFPEENGDMFDDLKQNAIMMFDNISLPSKGVAVGESFKLDYKKLMPSDEMLGEMSNGTELQELKVKFDKVVEKDGATIGYFSGSMEQDIDSMGTPIKMTIKTKMTLDITNNRCLSMELIPSFGMSTEEFSFEMSMGMYVANTYAKVAAAEEKKPEVTPKGGDE